MEMPELPTHFENSAPILRVEDMAAALHYYVDVLGFRAAEWGDESFTCVNYDRAGIYLCRGDQGRGGAWCWIGVGDIRPLYELYLQRGARIVLAPTNFPWALEMRIEDPDGNVLRFGSDPE